MIRFLVESNTNRAEHALQGSNRKSCGPYRLSLHLRKSHLLTPIGAISISVRSFRCTLSRVHLNRSGNVSIPSSRDLYVVRFPPFSGVYTMYSCSVSPLIPSPGFSPSIDVTFPSSLLTFASPGWGCCLCCVQLHTLSRPIVLRSSVSPAFGIQLLDGHVSFAGSRSSLIAFVVSAVYLSPLNIDHFRHSSFPEQRVSLIPFIVYVVYPSTSRL